MIEAFEFGSGAISSIRISGRAIFLVGQVPAVSFSVASKIGSDAMSARALERSVLAVKIGATGFVGVVPAIVVVIASPPMRYAFTVTAAEFAFGTFSINALANAFGFIGIVRAVVFVIAKPSLRYASVVSATEIGIKALKAIFWFFVAVIATVVFSVAEEPFRDASVIRASGTSLPAIGAIPLSANVGGLVGVVTAIVVEVALPQFRNAPSVVALEFRFWITLPVVTHGRIFIASVLAVRITVAFPGVKYASSVAFAFEFDIGARHVAILLVGSVPAVVHSVANVCGRRAIFISALVHSVSATSSRTGSGFIRSVFTVLFTVAFPEPRNAFWIGPAAAMLARRAICHASFVIAR